VYVRRTLEGDKAAFQSLVSRYSGAVFALVLGHLGKSADLEDVAQDVFLQAYRSLPGLKSPEKFGSWLYGISKRLCLNALRQRKGQEMYFNELSDGTDFSDPRSGAGVGDPIDRRLDVSDVVESLPVIYREVVTLRYMEDCSYGEIAQLLGITESAVNIRLIKARKQIRERLNRIPIS
jgi:RNA polymerase sigma-70 factor (ECF subfamily)